MSARVKSELWVSALLRRCDLACIPAYLAHRGDADSGAVSLVLDYRQQGCVVLTQGRDAEGRLGWVRGTGPNPVAAQQAADYVARQRRRDPDLWVIEIDDPEHRLTLDEPYI